MEPLGFLCLRVGAARLALGLVHVVGIAARTPTTPVPVAPPLTDGLAVVMNQVVPVLPLAMVIGEIPTEGGTFVLAADGRDARALLVDAAESLVRIEPDAMRPHLPDSEGGMLYGNCFEHAGETWVVLDLPALFEVATVDPPAHPDAAAAAIALAKKPEDWADGPGRTEKTFMVVRVGTEHYAVPTVALAELIEPGMPRPMPEAPGWIAGLIDLRGNLLLALSLHSLLGHGDPTGRSAPAAVAVVLREGGGRLALLADAALGIERIAEESLHEMPEAMAGVGAYTVTGPGRILGILSPDALLEQVRNELATLAPMNPAEVPTADERPDDADGQKLLVVRAGRESLAVPLDRVERIEPSVRMTPLPHAGLGFDALVDAGDRPVPIQDLRRRIGSEDQPQDMPPCVLIAIEGALAGLVVDQVIGIEDAASTALDAIAPDINLPFSSVVRIRGEFMPVLAIDRLLPPL